MALLLNQGDVISRSYSYTKPSPTHPVMPTFCGVRTGNLFDINRTQSNTFTLDTSKWFVGAATTSAASQNASCTVSDGKITVKSFAGGYGACFMIPVTEQTDYVLTFDADKISSGSYVGYSYRDANGDILYTSTISAKSVILTTYPNTAFIDICFRCHPSDGKVEYSNIMLNTGNTALPYEPYGWAEKITCAGQTVPVYLGQTQTVRKIRKLVLDGTENWSKSSAQAGRYNLVVSGYLKARGEITSICTHFEAVAQQTGGQYPDKSQSFYAGSDATRFMFLHDADIETLADFKTYLATQYQNGTPVTVWYVLETKQTSIINEPLCKIGDYADELHREDAGVTIPTVKGSNTLTVDTELQPSEMSITYKG